MANDIDAVRAASDYCEPRPPGADAMNNTVFVSNLYDFLMLSASRVSSKTRTPQDGVTRTYITQDLMILFMALEQSCSKPSPSHPGFSYLVRGRVT